MNNNAWIIWNELVKINCEISHLTVYVNYFPFNIYYNSLEIKIKFENYDMIEKISNQIFKQYGIDIHVDTYDNSFEIELKNSNPTHQTNKSILENLSFPQDIDNIEIKNSFVVADLLYNICIPLFNLPENLSQLKIFTLAMSFDLSNLPISLFLLDVSECRPKLNLDYLSNGLKVLYLPEPSNSNYVYNLTNLSNLPSSLVEIYVGSVKFNSVGNLIETFDEKIKHKIKLNNEYKNCL